jgi:hypothetical protein
VSNSSHAINGPAALQSASWGQFQILGSNFNKAGAASLETFVSAMCRSEQDQLAAFTNFVISRSLKPALAAKDWKAIAAGYNGTGNSSTIKKYSNELEQAYESLCKK